MAGEASNIPPPEGRTLEWLAESVSHIDWKEKFRQHRVVWRAAKSAIEDISANNQLSELEKEVYLAAAQQTYHSAHFRASLSASMYLMTKNIGQ